VQDATLIIYSLSNGIANDIRGLEL